MKSRDRRCRRRSCGLRRVPSGAVAACRRIILSNRHVTMAPTTTIRMIGRTSLQNEWYSNLEKKDPASAAPK